MTSIQKFDKAIKVIESCKTLEQLKVAERYLDLVKRATGDANFDQCLIRQQYYIRTWYSGGI